jgi:biotin carboxyl carrier protein
MSKVTAPLPGRIVSFKVKQGDSVTMDQALFVMEALKMENVILSEEAGTIAEIYVKEGGDVETGDEVMEIV